jgi:hypothetical protein
MIVVIMKRQTVIKTNLFNPGPECDAKYVTVNKKPSRRMAYDSLTWGSPHQL